MQSKLSLIAQHEFKMTAANKAFIIMTILGPFLILAITVLPSLLATTKPAVTPDSRLVLVCENEEFRDAVAADLSAKRLLVSTASPSELAVLKQSIVEAKNDYILELPADLGNTEYILHSRLNTDYQLYGLLQGSVSQVATTLRAKAAGIELSLVRQLTDPGKLSVNRLGQDGAEEKTGEDDFIGVLFTVLTFMMMIYMTVLLYGQMIGRSVVTEKTSKTVEIMLSSVRPIDLMLGKILGMGVAGLLQYGFWIGMASALRWLVAPIFNLELPAAVSLMNMTYLAIFFALGFFLYAAIYAALGAAAEDEQNLTQMAWPALIFLMVPLMMINTLVATPQATLTVFLSWFPMTSPIVMLARILVDTPQLWEILGSIAVLLVTIVLAIIGGSRVFRVGILMTGKKVSPAELLKWLQSAKN